MKKSIVSIALALSATSALAEITPQQVCQNMYYSTNNHQKCAQIISRGYFSQGALRVANKLTGQSASKALEVLEATVGRFVEDDAAGICEDMIYNTNNTVLCIKTITDARINPSATRVAKSLLSISQTKTIEALGVVVNAYIMPSAADICGKMYYTPGNTINCLSTIANKIYYNGAEQVCGQQVNYSQSKAISCLAGAGISYTQPRYPYPTQGQDSVLVDALKLRELRKSLSKARRLLKSGNLQESELMMDEALRELKTISQDNEVY